MAEQLSNSSYKPWMKINANTLSIKNNYTLPDVIPNPSENQQLAISYNSVNKKLDFITLPPAQGGINWLNEYDNATEYFIDDAVSYNGSSYICILTTTGNNPDNTMFWNLMASMGQQGKTGSSSSFFNYKITTTSPTKDPLTGNIGYNDVVQPLSTSIYISSFDSLGNNIDTFISLLGVDDELIIQSQVDSSLNQVFTITHIPIYAGINGPWWEIEVFNKSYTASFNDGDNVLFITTLVGTPGQDAIQPTFSIGTVDTLPAGSDAYVNLTGTQIDPIINFGLVSGQNGNNGIPAIQPNFSIGTVENLPYDGTPYVNLTGTQIDPIINFGLIAGTPTTNTAYTYYVSNQGLDTNNGSIMSPFQTLSYAVGWVYSNLAQTDKVLISVMAGTYYGDFIVNKNNLTISGMATIPSMTTIEGVILYDINSAGANIDASLYGLTIRGINYAGSTADNGSYVIGGCIIGTTQSGTIPLDNTYSLGGNRDITLSNCVVIAYDTIGISSISGRINCTATLINQTGFFLNNIYPLVQMNGNALISLFGCQLFSLNNTNQAPPIIQLNNTSAPSSTYTFNSCTIQYIFNTVNVAPLNKVCIGCTNTAGISMYAYNNLFIGEGTRISNTGVQYVIISKQGTGSLTINYGNNLCGQTANHYPTSASRVQLITATN